MNFTFLRKKIIDFLFNFSVISFGVSAYEGIWYGFIIGLIAIFIAITLSLCEKE